MSKEKKIKLFCLPYAGGSATIYSRWKDYLEPNIELYPIELSGRGRRFKEPLYNELMDAVDDVYESISRNLDSSPYALFGHSLGSIIVYELYYKILEKNKNLPLHIFFSGRRPPHIKREETIYHNLPEKEFKESLLDLGGTCKEFLDDEMLYKIFEPILRSDLAIAEKYCYIGKSEKMKCSITGLYGKNEKNITFEDMNEWRNYTLKELKLYEIEGDHFFINTNAKSVINILNNTLFN